MDPARLRPRCSARANGSGAVLGDAGRDEPAALRPDAAAVRPRRRALGAVRVQRQRLFPASCPTASSCPTRRCCSRSPSAVWAIAEILFAPALAASAATRCCGSPPASRLGFAGLSKYSAAFAPLGLLGFFLGSPRHRRWLWDFRPYLGAALALAIFSPALIWNAEQRLGFVRLPVQPRGARAELRRRAPAAPFSRRSAAQVALLSPWVASPVRPAYGARCARDADSGERFLLWLAAAAAAAVRAAAAGRSARDPALVQFRLAVRSFRSLANGSPASATRARGCGRAACSGALARRPSLCFSPPSSSARSGLLPGRLRFAIPPPLTYDWPSVAATAALERGRRAAGFRGGRQLARRRPRRRRAWARDPDLRLRPTTRADSPSPAIRRRLSAGTR